MPELMSLTGLAVAGGPVSGLVPAVLPALVPAPVPVFAAPETTAPILASLPAATPLPHFRSTGDLGWVEVMLPGGQWGWVAADPARILFLPPGAGLPLVLDPGHGGPADPGAQVGGLVERDLNLDLTLRLALLLQADPKLFGRGLRIFLTRADNTTPLALRFRTALAAAAGAAAFVSLHHNSHPDPEVHGTETFFKCGDEAAPSEREASLRLACTLHRRTLEHYREQGCTALDRGVICRLIAPDDPRSLYFVLREHQPPVPAEPPPPAPGPRAAVLLEPGYLSHAAEAGCLGSPAFRAGLARALYLGLREWLLTGGAADCPVRREYGR